MVKMAIPIQACRVDSISSAFTNYGIIWLYSELKFSYKMREIRDKSRYG
jgi:hypothetical protein